MDEWDAEDKRTNFERPPVKDTDDDGARLLAFVGEAIYTAWLSGYEKDARDGPALEGERRRTRR